MKTLSLPIGVDYVDGGIGSQEAGERIVSELVKLIHEKSVKTRILEVGCGVTLANMLFSENHASNTVYDQYSPYSRQAQLDLCPELFNNRAVSLENTVLLMKSLYKEPSETRMNESGKLAYYVANFQIGGAEKPQTTHGYIGVSGPDRLATFYHVTVPGEGDRKHLLSEIGKTGLCILYNKISELKRDYVGVPVAHVDAVYNSKIEIGFGPEKEAENSSTVVPMTEFEIVSSIKFPTIDIDSTLAHFLSVKPEIDNFLCYSNGTFHRFEDFFRGKHKILLYRGTFNPITNAHLEIYKEAVASEKPDFSALMIAHSIYSKDGLGIEEIKQRMTYADALGIPLVIGYSYRYSDTIEAIRERLFDPRLITNSPSDEFIEPEICFLMGIDTIQRIFESEMPYFYNDKMYQNVAYVYAKRKGYSETELEKVLDSVNTSQNVHLNIRNLPNFEDDQGISATQVREFLKTANIEGISKLIPAKILEQIIKNNLIKP